MRFYRCFVCLLLIVSISAGFASAQTETQVVQSQVCFFDLLEQNAFSDGIDAQYEENALQAKGTINDLGYDYATYILADDSETLLRVEYYDAEGQLLFYSEVTDFDASLRSYVEMIYAFDWATNTQTLLRTDIYEKGQLSESIVHEATSTAAPTPVITTTPTAKPTPVVTAAPTAKPTPVVTATPTAKPTPVVTTTPTAKPTPVVTATPTAKPTATPTAKPTATPTAKPTATPTAKPTATPTAKPTATPTAKPTATPTAKPTATPTAKPTATPTAKPTATPTAKPTATPTAKPTATPTAKPTATPTAKPTATPTAKPTATPTAKPTATPTAKPTATPTAKPTATPTAKPEKDYDHTTSIYDNDGETLIRVEYYNKDNKLTHYSQVVDYNAETKSYKENIYTYDTETETESLKRTDVYVNGALESSTNP